MYDELDVALAPSKGVREKGRSNAREWSGTGKGGMRKCSSDTFTGEHRIESESVVRLSARAVPAERTILRHTMTSASSSLHALVPVEPTPPHV